MNRFAMTAMILATAALGAVTSTTVASRPMDGHLISGSVQIATPPRVVWARLTEMRSLARIRGFALGEAPGKLTRVGDGAQVLFRDAVGTLVVLTLLPEKELRLAWEPDDAASMSHERWVLEPTDSGTRVTAEERHAVPGSRPARNTGREARGRAEREAALVESLTLLRVICETDRAS